MRQTIRKAAPEAEEAISYQIPTFKLNGNLVFFAAFTNHMGFYPTPSGAGAVGLLRPDAPVAVEELRDSLAFAQLPERRP